MSCQHTQYDQYGEDFYINEEGNLVEVTKVVCLECGLTGELKVVRPSEPTWNDPHQTKLFQEE